MTDIEDDDDLALEDEYDDDDKGIEDPRGYQQMVWEDEIQPYINGLTYVPMIVFLHEAWDKHELDGFVHVLPQDFTKERFMDVFAKNPDELWNHFSLTAKNCFGYGHLSETTTPFKIDAHVYRVNYVLEEESKEKKEEEDHLKACPKTRAWCTVDGQIYGVPLLGIFDSS